MTNGTSANTAPNGIHKTLGLYHFPPILSIRACIVLAAGLTVAAWKREQLQCLLRVHVFLTMAQRLLCSQAHVSFLSYISILLDIVECKHRFVNTAYSSPSYINEIIQQVTRHGICVSPQLQRKEVKPSGK
jgi:hypothetical protein